MNSPAAAQLPEPAGAQTGAAASRTAQASATSPASLNPMEHEALASSGLPDRPARDRFRWGSPLAVALAGYAHALSIAWPFAPLPGLATGQAWGGLQLASLVLLVWQLERAAHQPGFGLRQGALLGWCFATAMLCGSFWWLYISMHFYGGLPAVLTVLAVLLLAASLALYYALASASYVGLAPRSALGKAGVFGGLWLLAELARVRLFTGFPWGEGGYAHIDGWARPLAGWIGVHGLTFLAAFLAAWLVALLAGVRLRRAGPGGRLQGCGPARPAAACLALLLGAWSLAALPPATLTLAPGTALRKPFGVTLLQGNIPQDQKFQPGSGVADALRFYGAQMQLAQTPLVVLPETAFPMLPEQLPEPYWSALKTKFSAGEQAALIGIPLAGAGGGYSNAVLGLKPGAADYRYEKHHLVPFGEFVPPFFQWFIRLMDIPLGDFNRGAPAQASFEWRGERLAPNICYEDLFGEEVGASFADAATAPTVLVNVSNIGWFGNTVAIDQHLNISRMRALEFARPMLRATNTGATVVINAQGQVTHALERHTRGALVAEVSGGDGLTFYARWVSQFGLVPWWLLGLGTTALALASRRRTIRRC
jgi:apolipoprotein N-acyltransferase